MLCYASCLSVYQSLLCRFFHTFPERFRDNFPNILDQIALICPNCLSETCLPSLQKPSPKGSMILCVYTQRALHTHLFKVKSESSFPPRACSNYVVSTLNWRISSRFRLRCNGFPLIPFAFCCFRFLSPRCCLPCSCFFFFFLLSVPPAALSAPRVAGICFRLAFQMFKRMKHGDPYRTN